MNRLAAFLILMMASKMLQAACNMPQSFWDWPRSGDAVLSLKEIRPCIDSYLSDPKSKLVIHHGADDEDMLHSGELRAWLMSLAVDPSRITDASDMPRGLSIETRDH